MLVQPIWARLQHWEVDRVVLMPAGGLQLLPLHAAWRIMVDGKRRYLMDDYEVIYAPSAFGLKTAQTRASNRRGQAALVTGVSEYIFSPVNSSIDFPRFVRLILLTADMFGSDLGHQG